MRNKKHNVKRYTKEYRPCPACNGKGVVIANYGQEDMPTFLNEAHNIKSPTVDCPDCNGTGEIKFH